MTDHGDGAAGRNFEIDIAQNLAPVFIVETDVLETHCALASTVVKLEGYGIRRILDFAMLGDQAKQAFDIGQRLTNLAIKHAKKVEGHVKLDQEGVHQHDVAHCHG